MGDFKTAIDYHERHLEIAENSGDRCGEGKAYGNLGNAYHNLGDLRTALHCHERNLKIARELGDRSGEAKANANLGCAYDRLGDFKKAIDCHERDLKIAKELGDRLGEGEAYNNLGIAHHNLGDFHKAIDLFKLYLKISKQLGDRSGEGKAHGSLGCSFQSLGVLKPTIYHYQRQLKITKELGDTLGEAIACSNFSSYYEYLGQVPEAKGYCQRSVTLLNKIRDRLQFDDKLKIGFRDLHQKTYATLWRLMLKEGKFREALDSAEKGRAQGLRDLMAFKYGFEVNEIESSEDHRSFPPNTIFMAIGMSELVFWVCQNGKDVELRRKEISSQYDTSAYLQSLVDDMSDEIGVKDVVERKYWSFKLVKENRMAVKRSNRDIRQTQPSTFSESALNTLYDIIIDPIKDLFTGNELIFVPEGPLCLAPFAAFMDLNSEYLCESFKIRVAPSLTSLKMIADCPLDYHLKSGVLLVGDPWVQEVTELEQLPYAREEVEMIGRMLGCTPLIGRQATKDAVLRRLGSVVLVHIAAHGCMETGEIALAPDIGEMDFILTMKDVKRVQIRARLIVLSCCYSAHGEIKAEGVVGIARAFLGAGARSVLVSLWAIDDKATLEFMKNFYQHLVKGKSASESLNLAMNCMRESEEFGAVKYWAPFVLIGDDVTLELSGYE